MKFWFMAGLLLTAVFFPAICAIFLPKRREKARLHALVAASATLAVAAVLIYLFPVESDAGTHIGTAAQSDYSFAANRPWHWFGGPEAKIDICFRRRPWTA